MRIPDLETLPDTRFIVPAPDPSSCITDAYTSDLLSDVMAHAPENSVLVTIQAHPNTVAVATLAGIRAILICHLRPISDDMMSVARREGVAILATKMNQYEASHHLHRLLESSAS